MKKLRMCILPLALAALALTAGGCGNVYLRGDAAIAAETSTMDAYGAVNRAAAEGNDAPWLQAYLGENFKQWRTFVRSNRNDPAWGPKLPAETATSQPAGGS
jgi:hypothetical protein